MWANAYVGLPFEPFGRTRKGVDCWGLVRLVYAEQLLIDLPEYPGIDPLDWHTISAEIETAKTGWTSVHRENVNTFDLCVMRARGSSAASAHVGVMVSKTHLLHVQDGCDAVIVSLAHPQVARRITGFYRK